MKQAVHYRHARGFSLVELMVALTISLLLLAGVIAVVTSSSSRYGELAQTGRQIENGRHAIEVLKNDIRHSGYWGEWVRMDQTPTLPADPCTRTLSGLQADLPPANLQGYSSASAPTCLAGTPLAGTDVLVVRRVHTDPLPTGDTGVAGDFYVYSNARNALLVSGGTAVTGFDDGSLPQAGRRYLTRFYYVRPCSACEGSGDGIPTLWRTELVAGNWVSQPLVEGIENLQFEYGIDRNGDGQPNESSPGTSGDAYVSSPTADEWPRVVAVRAHVLARNIDPSAGHSDTKTYRLGGTTELGPFEDNFRRHVYSGTTRLMNTYWEASS